MLLLDGGAPLPRGLEPTADNFLAFMVGYLLIVCTARFVITNWRRSRRDKLW